MLDGTRKESTSKEETTEGNQLTHIWIGIILRCFQMPLKESSLAYNLNAGPFQNKLFGPELRRFSFFPLQDSFHTAGSFIL